MNKTRQIMTATAMLVLSLVPAAAASAQALEGPIVMKNLSGYEITLSDVRYVGAPPNSGDAGAETVASGSWTLKPGFFGHILDNGKKMVAGKLHFSLTTAEGTSLNWSSTLSQLDADGDYVVQITPEVIDNHRKLLGKTPVVVLKPVASAGPTDEQIARGAIKALGAALLHQQAEKRAGDIFEAIAIETARTARDELIKSAIEDLFTDMASADRATLGRLVPLALDGRLTDADLREAESKEAIIAYLQEQNPNFAYAAQAAEFLHRVQKQSR